MYRAGRWPPQRGWSQTSTGRRPSPSARAAPARRRACRRPGSSGCCADRSARSPARRRAPRRPTRALRRRLGRVAVTPVRARDRPPSSVSAAAPARSYLDVSHDLRVPHEQPDAADDPPPSRTTNWPTPFASQRASQRSTCSSATSRPPGSPLIQRITSPSPANSSRSSTSSSRGFRSSSRSVSSKRHHHRPLELDHDDVVLVQAARAHGDDSLAGPGVRLALLEHLRLGADRVAREDGRRQRHVAPAEVHRLLRDVDHREAGDEREREGRVDERAAPFGRRGIRRVEVDRVRVQRQQREPDVVGLEYRPSEATPVDVAHSHVLIRPTHVRDHRINAGARRRAAAAPGRPGAVARRRHCVGAAPARGA